jgi:group II intron reverse transcriptase/maturase
MNGRRESDSRVVPAKLANNAGGSAAEPVEERRLDKGSTDQQTAPRTQRRDHGASSALDRVRRVASRDRDARFTALLHHVGVERLRAAYRALSPSAAAGVDAVTWESYGQDLEVRLRDLHDRVQRGAYRAKPSRRVYIPKADGRLRPLGIAALEDKIVQRAVVEVLNAIYETDFLGFSYGFRPGRGPHDALDALVVGIERKKVNWVLDADIRDFFTSLDHLWLVRFLEHRIADRRVLRLIQKWLRAGVIEDGAWSASESGSPQGATVSPLLANVYLHYVFDLWVQQWRRRHARGEVIIVRYADDVVLGFQHQSDAERFRKDLADRLARFGLSLNADKTRLIRFGRFAAQQRSERGLGRPETFEFLGFTHYCATTKDGRFAVRRRTIAKRMAAKLRETKVLLMQRRHWPIQAQGRWLGAVVRGHLAYYSVPGNIHQMTAFRDQLVRHWYRALRRRGQRHRLTGRRCAATRNDGSLPPATCTPGPTSASTPEPKSGAQCVSSARWDLRGGPPARAVPTAIPGDPAEDRGARLGAGAVVAAVDQLDLEGGEERLGDGVIQAGASAAHGPPQPQPLADVDAGGRGVFAAAVGVEDRAVHPVTTTGSGGRLQGANDQASVVAVVHRPAEQVAGGQVDDRRQIQPALVGGDVGDITAPGDIGLVGVEQPPHQVRRGRGGAVSLVRPRRRRGR